MVRVRRPFPDVHHEGVEGEVAAVPLALITNNYGPQTHLNIYFGTAEYTETGRFTHQSQDPPVPLASAARWAL